MSFINEDIFGRDSKVLKAIEAIKSVLNDQKSILINGEVGVGKLFMGHWIHQISNRNEGKCLVVDCSKTPKLVENEILGHRDEEQGRFYKGVLERGNGGTVILKNIENLTEDFQKKFYRILQELPDYDINVRFVTTTTKNISKLVGVGRFYRALYLYLSDVQVYLPSLRDRKEDIEFIAKKFVEIISKEKKMDIPELDENAIEKLKNHFWGHNLIELRNVLENAVDCADELLIRPDCFSLGDRKITTFGTETDEDGMKLMSLKEAEKLLIRKALIYTSENRTQAAKILGVSIRTLRNKINEYRNDGANYFVNLR